jgi:PadR family transcriptional regulator PadR
MMRKRTNPDYLNGVPELVILQLLARRPMYGYELVQALKSEGSQTLAFGEGCIYPLLHRLEQEGSLTSRRQTVAGRSRVVYRVSAKGQGKLQVAIERWHAVVQSVHSILQGSQNASPALTSASGI